MRPTVTDQVVWSVTQSVTLVSPAKTAELIKMPFRLRIWVGPRNRVLDRGSDLPIGKSNFKGERGRPIVNSNFLPQAVQKGRTDQDAVWDVNSGGTKEACIM